MMNRFETYFDANYTYYPTQTDDFLIVTAIWKFSFCNHVN